MPHEHSNITGLMTPIEDELRSLPEPRVVSDSFEAGDADAATMQVADKLLQQVDTTEL